MERDYVAEINKIRQIAESVGYVEIPCRSNIMMSFRREDGKHRINLYYTTMTVTAQTWIGYSPIDTYHDVTMRELKDILMSYD